MARSFEHFKHGKVYLHACHLEKDMGSMSSSLTLDFTDESGSLHYFRMKLTDEMVLSYGTEGIIETFASKAGLPGAGWAMLQLLEGKQITDPAPGLYYPMKEEKYSDGSVYGYELQGYLSQLPGLEEKVINPASATEMSLKDAIINLNDTHGWAREKIADWLDTLDVDLRFGSEDAKLAGQLEVVEKTETELKLEKLDAHLKSLMEQIDLFQVSIADANKSFIALKEAIDNEQNY